MYKVKIDINADMGESFGNYQIGNDEELIKYVTSCNIACGAHGGDPMVMRKTVALAKRYNVNIGAHPSYPDLQGFGRRSLKMKPEEITNFIVYQLGALSGFLRIEGVKLSHVKPHGALYNDAVKNREIAEAIGKAILLFDKSIPIVGLSKSLAIKIWRDMGLDVKEEVFADRNYKDDGTLIPRAEKEAVITDPEKIAERVYIMATRKEIESISGAKIQITFDTICIHGDTKNAADIARKIKEKFSL